MTRHSTSSGFTAVELLITLFVAAAFLIAGYQLFNLVIKEGGNARAESAAGNIAYDYLRRYSDSAANPCTPSTPLTNQSVTIDGIANATISIAITCPQSDAVTLSKVEATVNYGIGSDAKIVRYATYTDKSRGAVPNPDITNGLIAWWQLNNSTASSAGSINLVNEGASPTTGQNGSANGAFAFVAANNQTLRADNFSSNMVGLSAFSITGWVYPQNNPAAHAGFFGFRDDAIGSAYVLQLVGTNNLECRIRPNASTFYSPSTLTLTPNTWQLLSLVYDGSTLRCYVNTTASTAVAATWSSFNNNTLPFTIGKTANLNMTGNVDDVRVYGRALSASEITQLATNGAK